MKTFSYFLATALLLFFSACSNNDSSIVAPYEKIGVGSGGKIVETAVITPNTPLPFITKYDLERKSILVNKASSARRASGPFTQAGNLRLIFSNRKVILGTNQSLYPPGAYFCDVYICDLVVNVSSGQFVGLQGASKYGYSNFDTQQTGINNTQVVGPGGGSSYTFSTYSLVPNYNSAGQYIYAGTIPQDLTGLTYTYSIFP
jgi:hypothetical protein